MTRSEWLTRFAALAEELCAACAQELSPSEFRAVDRTQAMLAHEDEGVVPYAPIGFIYQYRLQERRTKHLFGFSWLPIRSWKTVALFGMEEMWGSLYHTESRGVWCAVKDERVAQATRKVVERFAQEHGLNLDFALRAG